MNCYYNGTPKELTDPKAIKLLKEMCPHLISSDSGKYVPKLRGTFIVNLNVAIFSLFLQRLCHYDCFFIKSFYSSNELKMFMSLESGRALVMANAVRIWCDLKFL